jgi:hypothetical protein
MRQRPRGRTHIARRRRIVLGFDPVDISEYATARDRPTLWEKRNNATAEILMNAYRPRVVSEGIGEQSKGELLSRLSAAFAPAETVRRVPAQVKAGMRALWGEGQHEEAIISNRKSLAIAASLLALTANSLPQLRLAERDKSSLLECPFGPSA